MTRRTYHRKPSEDPEVQESSYAIIADELNDPPDPAWAERNPPGYGPITLDDLEPVLVEEARLYAEANDLPWPPGVGDFDRYYDRKVND